PRRVHLAPVPVHLTQRLVPAEPPDPVLHLDPPPGERPVVPPVRLRPVLPARLPPRRRPPQPPAQPVEADVAHVRQRPDLGPDQCPGQPRPLEHLQVGPPPRPGLAHVHDPAVLIDGHLALQGVRLLLPRVVGPLPPPGPLGPLLERIDDDG